MTRTLASLFVSLFSVAAIALPGTAGEAGRLRFRAGTLEARLSWLQGPSADGESILRVEWKDAATQAVVEPGTSFEVSVWMPSMGHGSSPTQLRRVLDSDGGVLSGSYDVAAMYFVMAGAWEVRFELARPDGTIETQTWLVDIAATDLGGRRSN